jgi:hypothetical protein
MNEKKLTPPSNEERKAALLKEAIAGIESTLSVPPSTQDERTAIENVAKRWLYQLVNPNETEENQLTTIEGNLQKLKEHLSSRERQISSVDLIVGENKLNILAIVPPHKKNRSIPRDDIYNPPQPSETLIVLIEEIARQLLPANARNIDRTQAIALTKEAVAITRKLAPDTAKDEDIMVFVNDFLSKNVSPNDTPEKSLETMKANLKIIKKIEAQHMS